MSVPSAADAAAALAGSWQLLAGALPRAWTRLEQGAVATVTGVAVPTLNGVWVTDTEIHPGVLTRLLDEVERSGYPYCLQARPGCAATAAAEAAQRGLTAGEPLPLMALASAAGSRDVAAPAGLEIRRISPAEAALHARVAAEGFESPVSVFEELVPPSLLEVPGVACYLGCADGEPVTTAVGITLEPCVGIFNVATPARHRGRGFGCAVTARAVAEGASRGAAWSWLQSSPLGVSVYERLGFEVLEEWVCWLHAPV